MLRHKQKKLYCKYKCKQMPSMKKLYSIITISLISLSSFSQDFNILPNDTVQETIDLNVYTISTINMEHDNSSSDSLELQWELIDNTAPAGWDYSFCDYTNCYAGNITDGTMVKFGENQTGFIKVNVLATTAQTAQFRFKVYNTGNSVNADTITFIYNAVLEINDLDLGKNLNIFPNPSEGTKLSINNILPNTEFSIQSALGQTVMSRTINSEKMTISNLDLRTGVYFIRFARNNNIYATRKLIVK